MEPEEIIIPVQREVVSDAEVCESVRVQELIQQVSREERVQLTGEHLVVRVYVRSVGVMAVVMVGVATHELIHGHA